MRSSKVIVLLCLAIVCGACASLQVPPETALREVACPEPRPEGDFICGVLDVLENPDARQSRTIPIRIVVLRAKARVASDPLFVIAGGPGQAATEGAFFRTFFAPVREGRDIVLIDQRGTGGSNALDLDPPPEQLFVRPETNIPPEWGRAALARLRGQADLT